MATPPPYQPTDQPSYQPPPHVYQQAYPHSPAVPYLPPVRRQPYRPDYRLYSPATILLAAFFGFPAAGFMLMGANYRAVGRRGAAWATWIGGTIGMVASYILGFAMLDYVPFTLTGGLVLFATYGLAQRLQGGMYDAHVRAGGLPASGWKAAGAVACTMTAFFLLLAGARWLQRVTEPPTLATVTVAGMLTVYGHEGVSETEARTVGTMLVTMPRFAGRKASCGVERTSPGHAVSFVLKPGSWDRPVTIDRYTEVGRLLQDRLPAMGPWSVHLRDDAFAIRRVIKPVFAQPVR